VSIRTTLRDDGGSALVEFTWLAILLMVPLVYVVLAGLSLQRTAFAETAAAREAARAYATAGSDSLGERRAEDVVTMLLRDQGVTGSLTGRVVSCGSCDYAPGSEFTVELHQVVRLPFVPGWLCGSRCVAGITVSAHHSERLDCYSGTGPVPVDARC
jgi:Flp pilus assembly protein TadG